MHIADQQGVDQQQQNRTYPYSHKAFVMDTFNHFTTSRTQIYDQSNDKAKENVKRIIEYSDPSDAHNF
ncbi:MAG TPA: hypothetical protein DCO90_17110 [Sphingobacterium sp.]|nr:hypothetical protein [Sphingobacterium sp.]